MLKGLCHENFEHCFYPQSILQYQAYSPMGPVHRKFRIDVSEIYNTLRGGGSEGGGRMHDSVEVKTMRISRNTVLN